MKKALSPILLVDDDEEDFLITSDHLQDIPDQPYLLTWAKNYDEAWVYLKKERFDVVFVDFRLGAESGLQLISEASKSFPFLPFILLTGQGDIETDQKALSVGASDYLVKSTISPEILDRSIRYSIAQAENFQKIVSLNQELENRVVERTQALQESQSLYQSIASNFPEGCILVLDPHFQLIFADGSEAHLFLSKPITPNKPQGKAKRLDPKWVALFEDNLRQVLNGLTIEKEIQAPHNGQYYSCIALPIQITSPTSASGKERILIVIKNISKQKQVEDEIKRNLRKERELNEMKSRFVSMASHEFRTPLGTILSSLNLAERYLHQRQPEKLLRHFEKIRKSVNNLNHILQDFLSVEQMEEGQIQQNFQGLELGPFLAECKEEMEAQLKTGQQIVLYNKKEDLSFFSDPQALKYILLNLMGNAIKYSGENSSIHLSVKHKNNTLYFEVKDEGQGIDPEDLPHLFERFYRSKHTSHIAGTGLGLYIAKRYVELLGGEIKVESTLNKGSMFTLRLPIAHY